jgi:predicted RNA-binding protein Jag
MHEQIVRQFFENLGITLDWITVHLSWEELSITLQTPESSLLIGMHGKNLESFQHIIARMIEKQTKKFIRVHLEVNDYMKAKDERLFKFLDSKIEIVLSNGRAFTIKNLNAFERKKAHDYIALRSEKWLKTHSEGEWENRVLILSLQDGFIPQPAPVSQKNNETTHHLISEDGVWI